MQFKSEWLVLVEIVFVCNIMNELSLDTRESKYNQNERKKKKNEKKEVEVKEKEIKASQRVRNTDMRSSAEES